MTEQTTSDSLKHEFESEKEGFTIKSTNKTHHASSVKKSSNSLELFDLVSDVTLAKSNIIPILIAPPMNNYGSMANSSVAAQNISPTEIEYQIKLLSAPQQSTVFNSGISDIERNEITTMILMILSIVIIAILLHLVISSVEKNSEADDMLIYKITAREVNNDPVLAKYRYMPVSY